MPSVKRPPSALWAVRASWASPIGCRPYSGTTDVPTSARPAVSAAAAARPTIGSTALAWEIQRLSNPAPTAYRATSRTSSTDARAIPPASPHRTPRRSPAIRHARTATPIPANRQCVIGPIRAGSH